MNPALRPTALAPDILTALLPLAALPWLLAAPATAAPPSTPPPAARSAAVWPLQPRPAVIRGFEQPAKPWLPGHRGLDLAGSPGQTVRSAAAGTITYAGSLAGRGVVVVSHGPTRTTYEPVIPKVKIGTPVTPGSPLGTLSAAGSHCAPETCLHWGLLRSTTYLNPLSLLGSTPVRLLPTAPAPTTGQPPTASDSASDTPADDRGDAGTDGNHPPPKPDPDLQPAAALGRPSGESGDLAAGLVVATACVLTLGGALMIRRH